MVANVLIKRTSTPNKPPPDGSLQPGELAVEMANPCRLWVGVPTSLDFAGKKLIGTVIVAEVPPTPAVPGMLWYEADTGIFWMYYADGTSAQWVQVNGTGGGGGGTVDAYTKAESDAKFEPFDAPYTKVESDAKYPPIPTVTPGAVGEWIQYTTTAVGLPVTLPAGGTWGWFVCGYVAANGAWGMQFLAGVSAGGTTVVAGNPALWLTGVVWRIS